MVGDYVGKVSMDGRVMDWKMHSIGLMFLPSRLSSLGSLVIDHLGLTCRQNYLLCIGFPVDRWKRECGFWG